MTTAYYKKLFGAIARVSAARPLAFMLTLIGASCAPAKLPEPASTSKAPPPPATSDPTVVSFGQGPQDLVSSLSKQDGGQKKEDQASDPKAKSTAPSEASPSAPAEPKAGGDPSRLTAVAQFEKINQKPDSKSPVIGVIRAGQSVRIKGDGPLREGFATQCAAGWYAIEPRGYVCPGSRSSVGTPDLKARAAAEVLPSESSVIGFRVGHSIGAPIYLRIPTKAEQRATEPGLDDHLARELPPDDAAGGAVDKTPAGSPPSDVLAQYFAQVKGELVDKVGAFDGRKLAWSREFDAEGRTWLVTPDLGLVPKDKVRVKPVPALAGVDLRNGPKLPIAFFWLKDSPKYQDNGSGTPQPSTEMWPRHSYIQVTGEVLRKNTGTFLKARDGTYVRRDAVTVIQGKDKRPKGVDEDDKWVSVRVTHGYLIAYEGDTPVYTTAISPGIEGVGHGRRGQGTRPGTHTIVWKFRSWQMAGEERGKEWIVDEVPFVAFYKGNFGLHGAWWHNDFGRPKSHGCVNIPPAAAKALFSWIEPDVPEGWYGVATYYPHAPGTVIDIRP
jgi:hypothetical protein